MTANCPRDGFVFIVTYGRSGSTLLQRILQSIDGYFIRGENNNLLLPLYRAVERSKTARYRFGQQALPPSDPWYGADHINPSRLAARLCQVFLEEIVQPPAHARVVGFKEIRYHEFERAELPRFLDFMAEHFQPCKILFNTRRPEDVAKSGWWPKWDAGKVRAIIEESEAAYRAYVESNPRHGYIVCYDDYVADPDSLRGMFQFLGEDFDRKRLDAVMRR